VARDGQVVSATYGKIISMALDPIEKKPFIAFRPGSQILSVGTVGCNLRCPFCQNHEIAQCGPAPETPFNTITPDALAQQALALQDSGNIGLAFTYNEPAVGWEFVRDASRAAKALGMQNAMVTNGYFFEGILAILLDSIDAFNIDLKCFTEAGYQSIGGGLEAVKHTIATAADAAHVEVTTLVVPGFSDSEAEMEAEAKWLASISPDIPLHISRYFPRWQANAPPTPRKVMEKLAGIAGRYLERVVLGNV